MPVVTEYTCSKLETLIATGHAMLAVDNSSTVVNGVYKYFPGFSGAGEVSDKYIL